MKFMSLKNCMHTYIATYDSNDKVYNYPYEITHDQSFMQINDPYLIN